MFFSSTAKCTVMSNNKRLAVLLKGCVVARDAYAVLPNIRCIGSGERSDRRRVLLQG